MADLISKSDSEQDQRRKLLSAARNGHSAANVELEKEYHVRVYSEAERSALEYEIIPLRGRRASQRHLAEWTQDEATMSDDTDLPSDRSL